MDAGSQRLSLEAGTGFPTGINSYSSSEKIGPVAGLQYLYGLNNHVGVGVQADYDHFAGKDNVINSDLAGGQVNERAWDNVATLEIMGR